MPGLAVLIAAMLAVGFGSGCSREHYRWRADAEVYATIREKASDPRWGIERLTIDPDPRSRFFDPHHPDRPPMPPDDPASHQLMHWVDGKRGWAWEAKYGCARGVENPDWESFLPRDETGALVLDQRTAFQLALLHSPQYQQELEDLYLSALAVTLERFRFDVQFFGGNSTFFTRRGPLSGRAGNSSTLQTSSPISARRAFATGAQLLVEVANSVTWQFAGRDGYSAITPVNISFLQPLLRGAGRAVILEELTRAERSLLANIRQWERFRQGFYLNVVAGLSAGLGPTGGLWSLGAASPGLTASVGGYLSLLEQELQIRNQRANVVSLRDSLERIDAFYAAGRISRRQVDEIRQSLYTSQLQLLSRQNTYQNQLDAYKITLGLPPRIPVRIQDPQLQAFDLLDPDLSTTQDEISSLINPIREVWAELRDIVEANAALASIQAAGQEVSQAVTVQDLASLATALDRLSDRVLTLALALREGKLAESGLSLRAGAAEAAKLPADQRGEALNELLDEAQQLVEDAETAAVASRAQVIPKAAGVLEATGEKLPPLLEQVETHLQGVAEDLQRLVEAAASREESLARLSERPEFQQGDVDPRVVDPQAFRRRVVELHAEFFGKNAPIVEQLVQRFLLDESDRRWFVGLREMPGAQNELRDLVAELQKFLADIPQLTRTAEMDLAQWNRLLSLVERNLDELAGKLLGLSLLQARVRLDVPVLTVVELSPEEAFEIARTHRLDWMNMRAALVDQWRQVEIIANRLKSDLSLVFDGNLTTTSSTLDRVHNTTGSVRVGVEFDAPLTRLAERNQYRQVLIQYQRARRDYYVFEDRVSQILRENLRAIQLSQLQFELQRANVVTAIGRVEQQRLELMRPPRPGQEEFTLGPTTARDLVTALDALLRAQNEFLDGWVRYEIQRMVLDYNLGTMQLDESGMWVDPGPITGGQAASRAESSEPESLPPAVEIPPELFVPEELPAVEPPPSDMDRPTAENELIQTFGLQMPPKTPHSWRAAFSEQGIRHDTSRKGFLDLPEFVAADSPDFVAATLQEPESGRNAGGIPRGALHPRIALVEPRFFPSQSRQGRWIHGT